MGDAGREPGSATTTTPAARLHDELADARVVELPLRGEWVAVHTPASRIPSHGTGMLGQRYTFDLIRFDPRPGTRHHPADGFRALILGVRTRDCHGWGEPILAPLVEHGIPLATDRVRSVGP